MDASRPLTFDGAGLTYIERYWWHQNAAHRFGGLLAHFLSANEGSAWFRTGDGEWLAADGDGLGALEEILTAEVTAWCTETMASFDDYRQLQESHRWVLFMDSRRFRACVPDPDAIPGDYYVGFGADWRWNEHEGTVFTPHFRVTTHWPHSDRWAPPAPMDQVPRQAALNADELAGMLWQTFWVDIENRFSEVQRQLELFPALLELGGKHQNPSVFFHLQPTSPVESVDDLLTGILSRDMGRIAAALLKSPDLRSTEITGGVMEGEIAVFNHRPSYESEFTVLVPVGRSDGGRVEDLVSFITGFWQEYDFDATVAVRKTMHDLPIGEICHGLWSASLKTVLEMSDPLLSMLSKKDSQERIFPFIHRLSGFLARIQIKAFSEDQIRQKAQAALNDAVEATRRYAEAKFTIRPIAGLQLLRNIAEGYPRAFELFNRQLSASAKQAEALPRQVEHVGQLLDHAARVEEQKHERNRQRLLEQEEQSAKLLNRVLAVVAVLAAIPLLVGQFETGAIATGLAQLGLGEGFSRWFGGFGLHFSFWSALIAFALTVWALVRAMRRHRHDTPEAVGRIARLDTLTQTLFDLYRRHDHPSTDRASDVIFASCQDGRRLWSDGDDACRAARNQVHQLDQELARATVEIMDQCRDWRTPEQPPADDEAWVADLEQQVGRFLLLSNLYDLKPRVLQLPMSLFLLRFCPRLATMPRSPVSEREFAQIMGYYGYTAEEVEAISAWGESDDVQSLTGQEVLSALQDRGVTALHPDEMN